ncbi:cytochrome-c peroxidase [Bremerella cremea]|uniref:Cytochrome-c peroxidase n=1 Tax=Bremerella cremea TaxID=1031537 RepID=A0A368KKG6_9BACT|nr:cytochrome c peroxidase [Bremerella cremea]RCS41268.1 cytochrome-c peroxidase [Bremerella cremea]
MKSMCLALAIAAASLTLASSISAAPPSNTVTLGDSSLTAGIPGEGPLTVEQINKWLADPANHEELKITLPFGLDAAAGQITGLDKNPMTRAKIELGRQLYFDTRLSSDSTVSCASCHHPEKGWAFDTQFGVGVDGQEGNRNSPVSFNRILSGKQFWDGRAATLEEQAVGPIANPIEMANTHEVAVDTIKKIPGYKVQFEKIFDDGVNIDNVGKAIATFERAIVTGPAPYDYYEVVRSFQQQFPEEELKYLAEDDPELYKKYADALKGAAGMSESARRGREIFFSEKGKCTACHAGANFTDELYHNLGVGMNAKEPDLGRYEVTKDEKDKGAFKTPTIRNIAQSPPYMHDGSQKTLEEVVEWYVQGGHPNPYLSDKVQKLNLTEQDKTDLVNFMKACTGEFPQIEPGRLPK